MSLGLPTYRAGGLAQVASRSFTIGPTRPKSIWPVYFDPLYTQD